MTKKELAYKVRRCRVCREYGVAVETFVENGLYYCAKCRGKYNVGTA